MVRRTVRVVAGLVVLLIASAPSPAYPEGESAPASALFTAEVFATPSYHLVEIPKVEEGGEGFAWAYLNQTPESWGRAISFWPGPTADTVFRSSTPQEGPLAGHSYRAPGAWTSYPPGGDSAGDADFGEPAQFPLGPTVETPAGTMRVLSFSGHADADRGVGDFAFGAFSASAAPLSVGFARSFASTQREDGAVVSTGWALARDVQVGDVSIGEIRSDATVRATPDGDTGTWRLTIVGVTIAGQRLEWTNDGVSFAAGSEDGLARLNEELAKGAEGSRSELQLVPGRAWRDDAGTHVRSGFLQVGHRPVVLENNPGQKMTYALSVVSAQGLYRLDDPELSVPEVGQVKPPSLGDDRPELPVIAPPAAPVATAAPANVPVTAATPVEPAGERPALLLSSPNRVDDGDVPVTGPGVDIGDALVVERMLGGAGESAAGAATLAGGQAGAAPAGVAGLGAEAAQKLRGGIGLVALLGVAAGLAVLRVARRQLELIGTDGEGG